MSDNTREQSGSGIKHIHLNNYVREFQDLHDYDLKDQGLVLSEETGELCEEILKTHDGKLFKDNSDPNLREELGHVIYTAWTIGILAGIDPIDAGLEAARRNQERGIDG